MKWIVNAFTLLIIDQKHIWAITYMNKKKKKNIKNFLAKHIFFFCKVIELFKFSRLILCGGGNL